MNDFGYHINYERIKIDDPKNRIKILFIIFKASSITSFMIESLKMY